uniref:nucleoprotein TPR-like n=1 Tax=Erigeron canadensis TaxID=72917 RepID=UPI001CB90C95|nr:nucleoprotein TPR-like [Erigeron canadensis]XP_043606050.1 nucleoprotein TPR-like [Erigeron canadensis]
MEDYNETEEQVSEESPTAGESGFVHVDSIIDSSSSSSSSSNTNSINQDDGVVVTSVDSVQDESSELKMAEDGGNEEFVDCPDDLVSYDGRTDFDESREEELILQGQQAFGDGTEILRHHYQEERRQLMTELSNLRHQLKGFVKQHQLIGGNDGESLTDELTSTLPLHEMINDCSRFIELALSEQSQTDGRIRDLHATIDSKDRDIDNLNAKVIEVSSAETTADRILSYFTTVLGEVQLLDTSVGGKLSHLEKNTSIILQMYNRFVYEVEMLNRCLAEVKSDYHMQTDMEKVFVSVREELLSLKRKEYELTHKSRYLEDEYKKLMQQLEKSKETFEMLNSEIGNLKGEVEVHKARSNNTKEKLNLAVTRGKSLVQQRDSLKQVILEKTNELDKCLIELQEKSSALEAANLLKESLIQRDVILRKCEEMLTFGEEVPPSDIIDKVRWLANERMEFQKVSDALSIIELPEAAQYPKLESRVSWLLESFRIAKDESIRLHAEISTTKEAARAEIDRVTASLLVEALEKNYLEEELINLKDKNESLQVDLQRSEDKTALLKEKLAMAVKKGKGLVQERAEKNAQIEALKLELKQQEATTTDYRDQISKMSKDLGLIEKLESDLLRVREERDQIEQFLVESNTILQRVVEVTDGIVLPVDLTDPVEKVRWCVTCTNECQAAKVKSEHELGEVKDEVSMLTSKLTDALTTMKSLEDALLVSEKRVFNLTEENREFQTLKTNTEEEFQKVKEEVSTHAIQLNEALKTMKSLEDALSISDKCVFNLTEENRELQTLKTNAEEEFQKVKEEVSTHAIKLNEAFTTMKSLEDALSVSQQSVFQLTAEKRELETLKTNTEEELRKANEEIFAHASKVNEALTTMKLLEDALSISEKRVFQLTEENRELEARKANTEEELQKVKEEVCVHDINLNEAYRTIKSLEDEKSQLQLHVSRFSNENEREVDDRNLLETEIKKLKGEAAYHEHNFVGSSATIKSLEDALLKAENTISDLAREKKNAEQQISTLNSQLNACTKELAGKHDRVFILEQDLKALHSACADVTKEMKFIGENNILEIDSVDGLGKLNYNPSSDVEAVDNVAEVMVAEEMLSAARNVLSVIEHCVDVKQNMSTTVKDLHAELEKTRSMYDIVKEENNVYGKRVIKLENQVEALQAELGKTRSMCDRVKEENNVYENRVLKLETELEALQVELGKTRSMYDKVKEDNNIFENRVLKLETELEAFQNLHAEMSIKLQEYQAKENERDKREAEFSKQTTAFMKDHEAENDLLPASEVKSLLNKINGITIPFPNIRVGEVEAHDSDPMKKLFYIIDSVIELLDHITLLSHSREELQSTLSQKALEIEHLKEELEEAVKDKKDFEKMKKELFELLVGFEHSIRKFGYDESDGGKKSADVAGPLPVLEKLIHYIILESENSKAKAEDLGVKLQDTQKVAEELASKVKLLENFNQSQTGLPDAIHERSSSEASSLPSRSEISEVEDSGSIGKRVTPLARTSRRGSNDHLALSIDPESERLIDEHETLQDKGHIFKSLHTSGLVPVQGKIIADRLDGIWVAGGGALMSRPRARLGLIAYWLVLHVWLLGTFL